MTKTTKEQREELARRLREAFDSPSVVEKNIMLCKAHNFIMADAERCAEWEDDADIPTIAYLAGGHDQRKRAEAAEAKLKIAVEALLDERDEARAAVRRLVDTSDYAEWDAALSDPVVKRIVESA
jgi:hypothetical protein